MQEFLQQLIREALEQSYSQYKAALVNPLEEPDQKPQVYRFSDLEELTEKLKVDYDIKGLGESFGKDVEYTHTGGEREGDVAGENKFWKYIEKNPRKTTYLYIDPRFKTVEWAPHIMVAVRLGREAMQGGEPLDTLKYDVVDSHAWKEDHLPHPSMSAEKRNKIDKVSI